MFGQNYDVLEKLNADDFIKPNSILCYGAGGAFCSVVPYMQKCGINIVGVIDVNKTGYTEVGGQRIPIYSIQDACKKYGKDTTIIITIANAIVITQVEKKLIEAGFAEERIFDMNVWTWLTKPSNKCYCRNIGGYIQFFPSGLSKCCNVGVVDAYICEWYIEGRPIRESAYNFLEKRQYYLAKALEGCVPLYCVKCPFLTNDPQDSVQKIEEFITSDHAECNADCVYCPDACTMPQRRVGCSTDDRFDGMVETLGILKERELLEKNALIQLASGEITIIPQKDKLFSLLDDSSGHRVEIFSNCFFYDERIEYILRTNNKAILCCDLDAGTPETYIKVKGFHKFYDVVSHLKRYAKSGSVRIKYIILPGINDLKEDYEGMIAILKELELLELQLSPEFSASRSNGRMEQRLLCYSTARFQILLENEGIKPVLPNGFFKKEDLMLIARLSKEIQKMGADYHLESNMR